MEGSLSLSCPEAARFVLLQSDLPWLRGDLHSGEFRTDNVFHLARRPKAFSNSAEAFLDIRELLIDIVCDRSRSLWQRLLVMATFCEHLDEVSGADKWHSLHTLMDEYRAAVGQGPSPVLEALSTDAARRVEIALTLSDKRCRDAACGSRFRNAFWDFVEGIGSLDSAAPEDDLDHFRRAETDFLNPFLEKSPFLLENYLLNYMFQHLFPYGRAGSDDFRVRSAFDQCLLLVTQFSWLTSLLVGVAGRYRENFSHEHVIATVQAFTRAVEHVPAVLDDALNAVKRKQLDSLEGMSILLRT